MSHSGGSDTAVVPAGVDTGGRTYDPMQLTYGRRSWCFSEKELGALAGAECMLEFALENLRQAVEDFEETGCRPGWVKEGRRLERAIDRLRAKVRAEMDA